MVYDLGLSAWRKPESVAGSAAPAIMIGCFVAFGGILFGYDTGYVSYILRDLPFHIRILWRTDG